MVQEPLELLAQPAVALEAQASVPLAVLGFDLLAVLAHDGQQFAAGVDDDGLEGGEVLPDDVHFEVRGPQAQVLPELLIVPGLGDAGGHVQHVPVDALGGEIHVDVQRLGRGEGQGGLADAGVSGNQHADLLIREGEGFRFDNHFENSFRK